MPHHVYANGNEIASKSADGKSSAAAPDVCFTTPPSVAAGTPVPFTNSCSAKDISNGSKTVLIKNAEIALENKSYFKKSTGDEGATQAFKKGIISGKITGKCYFIAWSPNVKVEGLGVTRHMDSVSHNHVNQANALIQKYRSTFANSAACRKDKQQMDQKCKPPRQSKRPKAKKRGLLKTLGNIATLPDKAAESAYGYNRNRSNGWVKDHCDGLWVKPTGNSQQFQDMKKQIEELAEIAQDPMKIIDRAMGEIWDMAQEHLSTWFLIKQGLKLGGKALVKNIIGGAAATTGVGVVVTAAMAASTVNDVIKTATTIAEKLGPDALEHVDDLMNMDKIKEEAARIAQEYKEKPAKALADLQTGLAKSNNCVSARRCQLVPYKETSPADKAARSGDGCCPGQSGHHIMPESMMEGKDCYAGHGGAPTMCVEGAGNSHGSHGAAHDKLFKSMSSYRTETGKDTLSYEDAREKALDSVMEPRPFAPASGCSRACLRQQLDDYYEKCKGEDVPAVAGKNDKSLPQIVPAQTATDTDA